MDLRNRKNIVADDPRDLTAEWWLRSLDPSTKGLLGVVEMFWEIDARDGYTTVNIDWGQIGEHWEVIPCIVL